MALTKAQVLEKVSYDRRTGIFRLRQDAPLRKAGEIAGFLDPRGFRVIRVYGALYYAHRLAWLIVYGKWPSQQIDHRNRNKDDNRIANLREATDSQQRMNSVKVWGRTGVRGVTIASGPRRKKFTASIKLRGKKKCLGYFSTARAAGRVYEAARRRFFGEFAPQ